jgi:hypothetical protein
MNADGTQMNADKAKSGEAIVEHVAGQKRETPMNADGTQMNADKAKRVFESLDALPKSGAALTSPDCSALIRVPSAFIGVLRLFA